MNKKDININFFNGWSHNMAYILGFLFADGNIVKTKRGTHFVSFYSADFKLLRSIKVAMTSTHKLSRRNSVGGIVYRIQIGSKKLFDILSVRYGLVPNKTRRMRLPSIPKKYVSAFVRGYFDGDGNVWSGKIHKNRKKSTDALLVCFTSASFFFLKDLLCILRQAGLIGGSLHTSKTGTFSRLSFSTQDALKMYQIMYNGSHTLFLQRKKAIFEKYIAAIA